MPSIALVPFDSLPEALGKAVHDFSTDTLKLMLTNVAPLAGDEVFADITEIAAGNGYSAGGQAVTVLSYTQTGGVAKLILDTPVLWTASGGPIADCQWCVLYNNSAANKELIGRYDFGSTISTPDGEHIQGSFDPVAGALTVANV